MRASWHDPPSKISPCSVRAPLETATGPYSRLAAQNHRRTVTVLLTAVQDFNYIVTPRVLGHDLHGDRALVTLGDIAAEWLAFSFP